MFSKSNMFSVLSLFVVLISAILVRSDPGVVAESSAWCDSHAALDIYSDSSLGDDFLPPEGITLYDYAYDFENNWFVSGTDSATKHDMVWMMDASGKDRQVVIEGTAKSIDAYKDHFS
ncbi:hypothetical protein FOZ63_007517, partial [Perkinsus olseni]